MSENYSKLEMALMDLDRAVSGLARQAEGVKKVIATKTAAPQKGQADLFSMLGANGIVQTVHPAEGTLDLDVIERRLDATIAQIEDLLNEDFADVRHG